MVIGIYTGMKTERKETKAGIGKIFAIKTPSAISTWGLKL